MLLTLPVELQTEIIACFVATGLDPWDLRPLQHTCRQLRALAMPHDWELFLYTFEGIETIFNVDHVGIASGSASALALAEWKSVRWNVLSQVEIYTLYDDTPAEREACPRRPSQRPTLSPLPTVIGTRTIAPIRLDRLRLIVSLEHDLDGLLPLLRSLDPVYLELDIVGHPDRVPAHTRYDPPLFPDEDEGVDMPVARGVGRLGSLPVETGWKNLETLTIVGGICSLFQMPAIGSVAFDSITKLTLAYRDGAFDGSYAYLLADITLLMGLCPNLDQFRITSWEWYDEDGQADMEEIREQVVEVYSPMLSRWTPASFWVIEQREGGHGIFEGYSLDYM